MSQRDRTALGVYALRLDPHLLDAVGSLAREGLVQLVNVHVVRLQAVPREQHGNHRRRTDPHNVRGNTSDLVVDEAGQNRQAELLSHGAAGQEHSCSAVGDLT